MFTFPSFSLVKLEFGVLRRREESGLEERKEKANEEFCRNQCSPSSPSSTPRKTGRSSPR